MTRIFSPSDKHAMRLASRNVRLIAIAVESGHYENVGDDLTGPVMLKTLPSLGEVIDRIKGRRKL